jgi:hypothetical protein
LDELDLNNPHKKGWVSIQTTGYVPYAFDRGYFQYGKVKKISKIKKIKLKIKKLKK